MEIKPPLETALQYDKAMKFWRKVEIKGADDCWSWVGATSGGYGRFGRFDRAHRIAYEMYYDTSIGQLWCCHKCDNPICCNPKHLYPGTPGDNSQDLWKKGRALKYINRKDEILQLYSDGFSLREIARRLGTTHPVVKNIVMRYKDEN